MEDDVKEDLSKPKEVKLVSQAGWLKKSSGRFLGGYKDRYIQLDRTQIVVYENEDLKNCIERVDLENFESCLEVRSPFKKKHRLVLTRAPRSGSKVCDVKLQAQNQEEKDVWIKALNDGISRAKNKVFDEVKVNENSSLEHVTRSRPKGDRGRRPPTRIHMKDVANTSSEGILKLDLDATDSTPNGTHVQSADGNEHNAAPEEATGDDSAPQKKVLKPPMPPSKETNPDESQESDTSSEEPAPQKKILIPPMPPSKEQKPSDNREEEKPSEEVQEKKVVKPPMPPSKLNKPSVCGSWEANGEKASDSGTESGATPSKANQDQEEPSDQEEPDNPEAHKSTHPPSPPSKDMKPEQVLIKKDVEVIPDHEDVDDKDNEEVKNNSAQCQERAEEENPVKKEDTVKKETFTLTDKVPKPKEVLWDSPSSALEGDLVEQNPDKPACPDTAQSVVTTVTIEPAKPYTEPKLTPCSTPESVKKSTGPPAPPKKKPLKPPARKEDSGIPRGPAVSASSSLPAVVSNSLERDFEDVPADSIKPAIHEPNGERKVVILSLSNAGVAEDSDEVCGMEVEEKSVDSGQLSAEESENSDQVTSSTDKLEGSFQGLDGETSEDDLESLDTNVHVLEDPPLVTLSASPKGTIETTVSNPLPAAHPCAEVSVPTTLPNTPSKLRAASTGDLTETPLIPQEINMKDLQKKVSAELEETGKLLDEIGSKEEGNGGPDPGILLSTAMEKLRRADQFLREAKSIKQLENKGNRTSW